METIVFEVKLTDERTFRVFCRGRNQVKRFRDKIYQMKNFDSYTNVTNGIHTIAEFEKLI